MYETDDSYDPYFDANSNTGSSTDTGAAVDDFDWNSFYEEYGDVGGGYDESTSPTEQDVLDAMETGTSTNPMLNKFFTALGDKAKDFIKTSFYDSKTGKVNLAGLATAAMALYGATSGSKESGGYSKPVPKLTASRERIDYTDPNRRPGEAGRQYFTDTKYDGTSGEAQKQGILAAYKPAAAAVNPYAGQMSMKFNPAPAPAVSAPAASEYASSVSNIMPVPTAESYNMAQGGIANLAKGGRYLSGTTDGMADKLRTSIEGKQPAALSHGEFVIPADVVSHLGNGNSDAGAKKLYEMMSRIRKARTGNAKQGKQIDANKFMPGGLATFAAGGTIPAAPSAGSAPAGGGIAPDVSASSSLSPWVGDYVTTALGEGAAAAAQPYQAYKGPLTAGASDLQQQAFAGSSEIAKGGYDPTKFTSGTFGSAQAQQYMNPYLKNVLDPQMAEMKRQADIARLSDAERLTKAGAFGGSRQAIMESEGRRNLLGKQTEALGAGYSSAYDKAMAQFNTEQGRDMEAQKATEESRKYSSEFGLKSLADLARQGEIQRGITSEGIAADKAQFEEQRDYGMKMPQYKLNLLQGLPIGANTTSADQDALSNLQSQIAGLGSLYESLKNLGQTPASSTTTPK
jgi:hypothetical protein